MREPWCINPMMGIPRLFGLIIALTLTGISSKQALAESTDSLPKLHLTVVEATATGEVDKELARLRTDLARFKLQGFKVRDKVIMALRDGSAGKVKLPNQAWVEAKVEADPKKGDARIRLFSDNPRFSTVLKLKSGGRLIVGGPKFANGVLVFVLENPL